MASSCTSVERANGRVLAVAGDVVELVAQGGVQASVDAVWQGCALARPGLASACSGARVRFWACIVPACVVPHWVEQRVWHVQEGEERLCDKVWHIGFEQGESEQMCVHVMPCSPRHGHVLVTIAKVRWYKC